VRAVVTAAEKRECQPGDREHTDSSHDDADDLAAGVLLGRLLGALVVLVRTRLAVALLPVPRLLLAVTGLRLLAVTGLRLLAVARRRLLVAGLRLLTVAGLRLLTVTRLWLLAVAGLGLAGAALRARALGRLAT